MANSYESHPLYGRRRCLLILAIFSFILASLACAVPSWNVPVWAFHLLWTFCSALWCCYDLVRYALEKARDPDGQPSWPSKKIMIGDALLMALFCTCWVFELANTNSYYSAETLTAYASVTALCYVILHAICFWKELIALKEAAWLKELHKNGSPNECQRCQHHHAHSDALPEQGNVSGCPQQPSATRESSTHEQGSPKALTTKPASWLPAILRHQKRNANDVEASAESPNESSCLITPFTDDESRPESSADAGGAMEHSIEHLEESEAVVKKKAKKGNKQHINGGGQA